MSVRSSPTSALGRLGDTQKEMTPAVRESRTRRLFNPIMWKLEDEMGGRGVAVPVIRQGIGAVFQQCHHRTHVAGAGLCDEGGLAVMVGPVF